MGQNIIEIKNLTKIFNGQTVLNNINLNIKENEFLTILGPSGCGKTTTLRIIAGFENYTSGTLLFNGQNLHNVPPHKRNINTIFQNYALFYHMNVMQNIAFGLKIKKVNKHKISEKVEKILDLVNLKGFEKREIRSLSGGQQQRVAIARALVNEPKVLLLDEPLGALDLKLRKEMQVELKNMQKSLGITFIFVTHDQEEALTMSETIVVMDNGNILQKGSPEDIYNEPTTSFVANFIGISNIVKGQMKKDYEVIFFNTTFVCLDIMPHTAPEVEVVIRPEDIKINEENGLNNLKGTVIDVVFFGVHYEMKADIGGYVFKIHSTKMYGINEIINLSIYPEAIHIMAKGDI